MLEEYVVHIELFSSDITKSLDKGNKELVLINIYTQPWYRIGVQISQIG